MPEIKDFDFDEIIINQYPSPVAIPYEKALAAKSPFEKVKLLKACFEIGIRSISLSLVINYLRDSDPNTNNTELNKKIKENYHRVRDQEWIELLRLCLEAYKDNKKAFFMQELYEFYWSKNSEEAWGKLQHFAALINDYFKRSDGDTKIDEAVADDMVNRLRNIFRLFDFFTKYELWLIVNRDRDRGLIEYSLNRGTEPTPLFVDEALIQEGRTQPLPIRRGFFYLVKDVHSLYEVDPLIIDPQRLEAINSNDEKVAIFDEYEKNADALQSRLQYLLLATDMKHTATDPDLIRKFIELFETLLTQKDRELRGDIELNWRNIVAILARNMRSELDQARSKRDDSGIFIPRTSIQDEIDRFVQAPQRAIAVTGDVGVGKTNLFLNIYDSLSTDQYAKIWVEITTWDTQRSLAHYIVQELDGLDLRQYVQYCHNDSECVVQQFLKSGEFRSRQLVIFIDAINENKDPIQAITQVNTFINQFENYPIKVFISSRPQTWQYAQKTNTTAFRRINYYAPDGLYSSSGSAKVWQNSILLEHFDKQERGDAFKEYCERKIIDNSSLNGLNERLQAALSEPLIMSIVCQTYAGSHIPENLQPEEIIENYLERLYEGKRLTRPDVENFLEGYIVPLFVQDKPVERITRSMAMKVRVSENLHLDDLIDDKTKYTDGTTVNEQFRHLMNTGWMVISGNPQEYLVDFKYEYFYDYFVGENLIARFEDDSDKLQFLNSWAAKLSDAPFLWGPLRRLFIHVVQKEQFDLLEQFGYTSVALHRDLLISVIKDQYDLHKPAFDSLFQKWLQDNDPEHLSREIAVSIAVEKQIRNIIVAAISHPDAKIRSLTVQRFYDLWVQSPDETLSIMHEVADEIAAKITLGGIFSALLLPSSEKQADNAKQINTLMTLLLASMMLIMKHYNDQRFDKNMLESIRSVWKPILESLRKLLNLVPRAFGIRKRIFRLLVNKGVLDPLNEPAYDTGYIVDIPELAKFFPADEKHKRIIQTLAQEINAVAEHKPFDAVQKELETLITSDNDYFTAIGMGLVVFVVHLFTDLDDTAQHLKLLMDKLVETFPVTQSPDKPTGPLWFFSITWSLGNIKFSSLDKNRAENLLRLFADIVDHAENHFLAASHFVDGKTVRRSTLADVICWSYEVDVDLGREALKRGTRRAISEKDEEQLLRYTRHLPEAMAYHKLPRATLIAIHDYFMLLRPLLDTNPRLKNEFWKQLGDGLRRFGIGQHEALQDFIAKFEAGEMPDAIRRQILEAPPYEDVSVEILMAGLQFVRYALADENPAMRNFVRDAVHSVTEYDNLVDWILSLTEKVANTVYGDVYVQL